MATDAVSRADAAQPPEPGACAATPRSPTPTRAGSRRSACASSAEALGVAPMALYRHVANKDDLIDGMVDVVFGEIELPSRGGLEDRDAPAGDLGPRRPVAPPLGDRPDGVADDIPVRRTCATTTR